MAALFPRWTNAVYATAIVALLATAAAAIAAPMIIVRTPYGTDQYRRVVQPVAFDHRHHVRDDAIDCLYCHPGAERTAQAGIPPTALCMGCHGQIWSDSPQLAPVRESWRTGIAINWRRVHDVPDHVYFHHGVHTQAGVVCATCHGDVRNMARVERRAPLTMSWCLDCHRQPPGDRSGHRSDRPDPGQRITSLTTCSACHR
jgi:Cytochrome c3